MFSLLCLETINITKTPVIQVLVLVQTGGTPASMLVRGDRATLKDLRTMLENFFISY